MLCSADGWVIQNFGAWSETSHCGSYTPLSTVARMGLWHAHSAPVDELALSLDQASACPSRGTVADLYAMADQAMDRHPM